MVSRGGGYYGFDGQNGQVKHAHVKKGNSVYLRDVHENYFPCLYHSRARTAS